MELQEIAAGPGGEHLAPGGLIEHRGDQPVVVELDAQVLILEVARSGLDRRSVGIGPGGHQVVDPVPARRARSPGTGRGRRRAAGSARWRRPGHEPRVSSAGTSASTRPVRAWESEFHTTTGWWRPPRVGPTGQLGQGAIGDALGLTDDLGVVTSGVLVHPVDARSGDDVVELVEEQRAPGRLELLGGVGAPGQARPTARRRAGPARRGGCPAWWRPGWCRCRGGTRGRARPTQTAGSTMLASAWSKKARAPSMVSRGMPSSRPGAGPTRASRRWGRHHRRRSRRGTATGRSARGPGSSPRCGGARRR